MCDVNGDFLTELSVFDSVHAEKLTSNVLQSVVDLLWSQLDSMNALLMNTASHAPEINDESAVPSNDEFMNNMLDEAQMQCNTIALFIVTYNNNSHLTTLIWDNPGDNPGEKYLPNIPPSLSSNSSQALPTFSPSLPLGSYSKDNVRKQLKET